MPAPIALTGSYTYLDKVEFTASYVEISNVNVSKLVSASAYFDIFCDSASFASGRIGKNPTSPQIIFSDVHEFIYNEEDGDLNLFDQAYNALQTIAPYNSMSAITS